MDEKHLRIADAIITHTPVQTGCPASHIKGYLVEFPEKEIVQVANSLVTEKLIWWDRSQKNMPPVIKLTSEGTRLKESRQSVREYLREKQIKREVWGEAKKQYNQQLVVVCVVFAVIVGLIIYFLNNK